MKNLRLILLAHLFVGILFALHGKIVFYDGTYVVGKVTKVDESAAYIIPIGLDTSEGVLIGNIDSLKLENGMMPVVNSAIKYFYDNGEFLANDKDWMDEYDNFKYDDYALIQEEYKYEETKKTNSQFWSATIFGAYPAIRYSSLSDSAKLTKMNLNLGVSLQAPFFPVGAVDISPGFNMMTFGFDNPDMGVVDAIQVSGNIIVDIKPILFFLPKPLHLNFNSGISYNIGFKVEPTSNKYEGDPKYGGVGFNLGTSMDYHLQDLPLAFRIFINNTIIPQGIPFPELKTGYVNVGANLILILKRHH